MGCYLLLLFLYYGAIAFQEKGRDRAQTFDSMSSADIFITRDRLQEFTAFRKAARRQEAWLHQNKTSVGDGLVATAPRADEDAAENRNDEASSSGATAAAASNSVGIVPPPWVRALEHFSDLEATVSSRIDRLHKQQHEFFSPKFVSAEEEEDMQHDLDVLAADVQKLLKELERMVLTGVRPADAENIDESMAAKNVQKHLSTRLTRIMGSYRDGQQLFVDQLKARQAKVQKFRKVGTDEVHSQLEREEKVAQFLEQGYTQADISELLAEEARQQEISSEVQSILASITELHEMFKDLHMLVVEQGTVLDRIDYNIRKASENTIKGIEQLKKAHEHQKRCTAM
jgi:syntaxin 16